MTDCQVHNDLTLLWLIFGLLPGELTRFDEWRPSRTSSTGRGQAGRDSEARRRHACLFLVLHDWSIQTPAALLCVKCNSIGCSTFNHVFIAASVLYAVLLHMRCPPWTVLAVMLRTLVL